MMSPCKDCADRVLGCHSSCESYQAYTEKVKALRERRIADCDFIGYQKEQIHKQVRKRNMRRKK
jgi:hypothetical protein